MNRRGFLGSLLALVATPILAKLPLATVQRVETITGSVTALPGTIGGFTLGAKTLNELAVSDIRRRAKEALAKWYAEKMDEIMYKVMTE